MNRNVLHFHLGSCYSVLSSSLSMLPFLLQLALTHWWKWNSTTCKMRVFASTTHNIHIAHLQMLPFIISCRLAHTSTIHKHPIVMVVLVPQRCSLLLLLIFHLVLMSIQTTRSHVFGPFVVALHRSYWYICPVHFLINISYINCTETISTCASLFPLFQQTSYSCILISSNTHMKIYSWH